MTSLNGFKNQKFNIIQINELKSLDQQLKTTSRNGFAQVTLTSPGGALVKADTDCTVQVDPEARSGWNLTNDVAGTKFNLYYFNGLQEIITLADLTSLHFKAFININSETQSIPFMHVYTKPTGVGDAAPWYHSKIDYIYNNDNTIGIGEECVFFAIGPPNLSFSQRLIRLNTKNITGDALPDEEILYMVTASDSSASVDQVNVTINQMGFGTSLLNRQLNLDAEDTTITGDATAANQVLQLDQETVTASNTTSIDNKITKGNDLTLVEAQQVLVYGEVTSGPGTGELHPIHITNAGDVEVEIADYVKGQLTMVDSFPVVIASDQSSLTVSETFLRATQTLDFTVAAGSNNTSTGINMSPGGDPTYRKVAIFGETDNVTDLEMYIQFSNDNLTWYTAGGDEQIFLNIDPLDPAKQIFYKVIDSPPQWIRLLKLNSTLSLETLTVKSSKIN
jgi:hypothetical protein